MLRPLLYQVLCMLVLEGAVICRCFDPYCISYTLNLNPYPLPISERALCPRAVLDGTHCSAHSYIICRAISGMKPQREKMHTMRRTIPKTSNIEAYRVKHTMRRKRLLPQPEMHPKQYREERKHEEDC